MKKFLVAIDQGTTSTKVILFDIEGNIKFKSQFEIKQYFPKNGWVEHNPNEIWLTTLKALKKVIKKSEDLKGNIISLGITNQRETTILWNKKTGKPIYNAIVWQDRRTQKYCENLKKRKYEKIFRKKTGLFIDPYFSATKIKWILENVKVSKKLLKSNNLLFGTVDTFLIWKLTKGKKHLTEATNASRTMLFNINNNILYVNDNSCEYPPLYRDCDLNCLPDFVPMLADGITINQIAVDQGLCSPEVDLFCHDPNKSRCKIC